MGRDGYLFTGYTYTSLEMETSNVRVPRINKKKASLKDLFVRFLGDKSNGSNRSDLDLSIGLIFRSF